MPACWSATKQSDCWHTCPPSARKNFAEVARLLEMPAKKRITLALDRLKILMDPAYHETVDEIHPAWLARVLEQEPPRLAGLVLHALPPRHAQLVLKEMKAGPAKRLAAEMRNALPSPRLAELFQTLLARRFRLASPHVRHRRRPLRDHRLSRLR